MISTVEVVKSRINCNYSDSFNVCFAALFIDTDVLFKKYYLESFASKEFRIWAEAGFFV